MVLTQAYIKQVVQEYFKDKPVQKVYLFGSYARGEADENSDIDLLVDLDRTKHIGWQFYNWHNELQEIFKQKVDVVSNVSKPEHTSNWNLIVHINQQKKILYEKG
ncbi:MAG TPA: nucleotidyltransferase domain-containing protein [Chitinophagaceae bacterium]|nr:nucleotidyltransferase domain-containing protein [Chitinophagaceae bacterium]